MNDFYSYILPSEENPENKILTFNDIQFFPEPLKAITIKYLSRLGIDSSVEALSAPQINEIESYLKIIGLIKEVKFQQRRILYDEEGNRKFSTTTTPIKIINQPGMRYCIIKALADTVLEYTNDFVDAANQKLLTEKKIRKKFSTQELNKLKESVLNRTKGKIMEDIVLIETQKAIDIINKRTGGNYQVYKLEAHFDTVTTKTEEQNKAVDENSQFKQTSADKEYDIFKKNSYTTREIDMVVQDTINSTYRLFEIKHSKSAKGKQKEHLKSNDIIQILEGNNPNGKIIERTVLYKGDSKLSYQYDQNTGTRIADGVTYYNIEDFLYNLGEDPEFILKNREDELRPEEYDLSL